MILGNRMLHFEIRNFRLKCKGSRDQREIYLHEYPSFYLHGNDFETRNNFCLPRVNGSLCFLKFLWSSYFEVTHSLACQIQYQKKKKKKKKKNLRGRFSEKFMLILLEAQQMLRIRHYKDLKILKNPTLTFTHCLMPGTR